MKKNIIISIVLIALGTFGYMSLKSYIQGIAQNDYDKKVVIQKQIDSIKPKNNIDDNTVVVLETTQGIIELALYPKYAPLAVENFVTHVKNGYYDGLIFHRIIKGFMIQGGDPTGTGRGGKSIWNVPFKDEFYKDIAFDDAGVLAMANAGYNTNGSQFFITTNEALWLNGRHTIFGKVISNMETVTKLENVPVTPAQEGNRPLQEQKILKAYIK